MPELKIGSQGAEVLRFYDYFTRWAKSYANLLGKRDGYYGNDEARFTSELQRRLGLPITGRFGDVEANRTGYRWTGTATPPPAPVYRKIWLYSAPGSGGNWDQGPSFDLGNRCKDVLHINHQPISFQKGGYLGFMGGDPTYSYVDVTYDQYKSLEWLLDHNPDINDPDVELWFSGYSQSADGMEDALEILFGDGGFRIPKTGEVVGPGKYRHLRSRINGLVQFGNPSTKGTGIARKVRPAWLDALVRNVNYDNDFYAVALDAIRPPMYAIIVQAEMELPFFVHVLRLAARIIPDWLTFLPIGGMLGGIGGAFGPVAQLSVGAMTGLGGNPALGQLMGMAGGAGDTKVDDDLYNLLKPTGVLSNIPGLSTLIGALPGLQAHGNYPFDPVMMDRAYDHIAGFRR
ncbi:peptidoglycan-binding protein [Mycobacterium sp. TY815]|uniref:peptidoglycan-binding protein n=1 Tax=Mycobacterium sp. TY815 TaxID=3050581 RepID=UPI0027426A0B|nr:peptidoglycan-binding protein [Mycobacterium sp. TY815]MDP7703167.1 peptidoglycan-binding protein [Mycobacterium sp. TY815]